MNIKTPLLGLAFGTLLIPVVTMAADHIDSPAAVAEPAADLTDLYAWTSPDASKINLIMDATPFAGSDAKFSDAVQYIFHVNSSGGYGMPQTETKIICEFDAASEIQCWAGSEDYAQGDASAEAGLMSVGGGMKVFAGLRNDPFFMEFTGFTNAVSTVVSAAAGLTFDDQGCPLVDEGTSGVLVGQLQSGADGAAASDTFSGANVLSLVIQIDKELVNAGGPLLGVWASTHTR